ncbi:hypothetical protein [Hanstruepera marina]|uniref:hypothetical protein n=1 Tax=Hanstruepera marina TaxID=2873265 RepID=UPI001CA70144|nr:hypothetical protein [Hanstruepera marina]
MKRKNKIALTTLTLALFLMLLAGNTHRILPTSCDPCQTDISHKDHINELPMFHCFGHTEYIVNPDKQGLERVAQWDHLHSWMTLKWHLEKGFTEDHALDLIKRSTKKTN